jgi:hypothetical protein
MSHFFDVYGPFDVARTGGLIEYSQPAFWSEVEDYDTGLSKAIGCYMFCLTHGTNIMPWYVGKTWAKNGFRGETFTPHKLVVYNRCINGRRALPQLFLFPLMTGTCDDAGNFSHNRSRGRKVIEWLEKTMIGMALQRNPDLGNLNDATLPRSVTVRGIMGEQRRGRAFADVTEACRAFYGNT